MLTTPAAVQPKEGKKISRKKKFPVGRFATGNYREKDIALVASDGFDPSRADSGAIN